uniref:UBX domain-containing protein n=1 Tax=Ditylenchus dipsaci TaxID=166011 RepID=A0A915E5L5_9BILA
MESDEQSSSQIAQKADRNAVFYPTSFSNQNFLTTKEEESDDFFEQTPQDLKYRQRDLIRQAAIETNRPFLPRSYLENKNRERKVESYKHTVVRLSFNNTFIVQALFYSSEPVSHLFEFVTALLGSDQQQQDYGFSLYLFRDLLTENSEKSLLEAGIAPMSKITVRLYNECCLEELLKSVAGKAKETDLSQADSMTRDWLSVNTDYIPFEHTLISTEGSNGSVAAAKRIASMISGKRDQSSTTDKQEDAPYSPVDYSKYSTPKSEYPKWMKGKK